MYYFQTPLSMKFNENPTNGSCVVTCGDIDERMDRQKNIIKLLVVFYNFFSKCKGTKCSLRYLSYLTLVWSRNKRQAFGFTITLYISQQQS